jgi:hypothetical protein
MAYLSHGPTLRRSPHWDISRVQISQDQTDGSLIFDAVTGGSKWVQRVQVGRTGSAGILRPCSDCCVGVN